MFKKKRVKVVNHLISSVEKFWSPILVAEQSDVAIVLWDLQF